jgi:hypothetical protein
MTRSKALPVALVTVIVLGVGGWSFASPYMAVTAMRNAADTRDGAALAGYVDFPALRESLKTEVTAQLTTSTALAGNPLLALGAALVGSLAGPAIDGWVTPESLAWLLRGQRPPLGGASTGGPTTDLDASMGYSSFSTFVVDVKPKGALTRPFQLVLTRNGLTSWKLTAVHLSSP